MKVVICYDTGDDKLRCLVGVRRAGNFANEK